MLHSINKEQRLYVFKSGNGFSCRGFESLDNEARAVYAWLESRGVMMRGLEIPARKGTKKHYARCEQIMSRGANEFRMHGAKCLAALTPQLNGLEGQRVEVVDNDGNTRRFIVGKSIGWMPCHLEIARRNSSGGCGVYGTPFKSVRVL